LTDYLAAAGAVGLGDVHILVANVGLYCAVVISQAVVEMCWRHRNIEAEPASMSSPTGADIGRERRRTRESTEVDDTRERRNTVDNGMDAKEML